MSNCDIVRKRHNIKTEPALGGQIKLRLQGARGGAGVLARMCLDAWDDLGCCSVYGLKIGKVSQDVNAISNKQRKGTGRQKLLDKHKPVCVSPHRVWAHGDLPLSKSMSSYNIEL